MIYRMMAPSIGGPGASPNPPAALGGPKAPPDPPPGGKAPGPPGRYRARGVTTMEYEEP